MKRTGLFNAAHLLVAALLIAVGGVAVVAAPALAEPAYSTQTMGSVVVTATQAAGAWYTDRYAPASFESTTFEGQSRLRVGISSADSSSTRPPAYNSAFYNTQGRKFDVNSPVNSYVAGDLYIGADWATQNRRSDLWATTSDASNAIAGYPVFGFVHSNDATAGANGFRVFDQTGDGSWVVVPLPEGFTYGTWHNLRIQLNADSFTYYLDGKLVYTDKATFGSVRIDNMMVQAYNFSSSYDVYWDNVAAHPVGYVEPALAVWRFHSVKGIGSYLWTADPGEKAYTVDHLKTSWTHEGQAFAINENNAKNSATQWRFRNKKSGSYFYTSDPREKANVETNLTATWIYEGPTWNVSRDAGVTSPVWRFRCLKSATFLWTADPDEMASIDKNLKSTYKLEGIAYYLGK